MAPDCGSACPVEGGFLSYNPSIAGNSVYIALYGLLVPVTVYLGIRHQNHVFSLVLTLGLLFEVLGFTGRLLLHGNRDSQACFFLFLLGTLLGPTVICQAVFTVLPHVLSIHGENGKVRPVIAGFALSVTALAALAIQVVGVSFMTFGHDILTLRESADIIAAGLAVQAAGMIACLWMHFRSVSRLTSPSRDLNPKHLSLYRTSQFKRFLQGLALTTILLFVYATYRVIEMAFGVDGILFQSQVAMMVMEGAVPFLSAFVLVAFHPGRAFGSCWASTSPRKLPRRTPQPLHLLDYQQFQHQDHPQLQHHHEGYQVHHRYDPNIRKQTSPTAPKYVQQNHRRNHSERTINDRSLAGLPSNPRSGVKPPSPLTPSSKQQSPTSDRRWSDRTNRNSGPVTANMVDRDALW